MAYAQSDLTQPYQPAYENRIGGGTGWKNAPDTATPLNAENLNKGDYALWYHDAILGLIYQRAKQWDTDIGDIRTFKTNINNRLDYMNSALGSKASITQLNNATRDIYSVINTLRQIDSDIQNHKADITYVNEHTIQEVRFDTNTQKFSFYRPNSSIPAYEVDLYVEKLPIRFWFSGTKLMMRSSDGTTSSVDLASLIVPISFDSSPTIVWTKINTGDGSNKFKAEIRDGSITDSKLESGYLQAIKNECSNAKGYSELAEEYSVDASESALTASQAADRAERLVEHIVLANFHISDDGYLFCTKEYEDPLADRFTFAIINDEDLEVTTYV